MVRPHDLVPMKDIFWRGYKVGWCSACRCFYIACFEDNCNATSCNCTSCEYCHEVIGAWINDYDEIIKRLGLDTDPRHLEAEEYFKTLSSFGEYIKMMEQGPDYMI